MVFDARIGAEGEGRASRGMDSIELVQHEGRWRIASITTDFERPGKAIPARFLEGGR